MGAETEYAVTMPLHPPGVGPAAACAALLDLARHRLTHLPAESGIFLANGGRLYRDVGDHPEYGTPEADDPAEAARQVLAGDLIMADLAREAGRIGEPVAVGKWNVDYLRLGATWAYHDSYGCHAGTSDLQRALLPHLAARVCFGAGGLNPFCPGIEFSLSPRAHTIVNDVSSFTTGNRGLFNTKQEPLAGEPWWRIHVTSGDGLRSPLGLYLRFATTALVVAMAEGGLDPGGPVRLQAPVAALHARAVDPSRRVGLAPADGGRTTALEIQRRYLELAESRLEDVFMPAWAPEACRRWRSILERLERGPAAVERALDWAIKRSLFLDHLRSRGIDPDSLPRWNRVLQRLFAVIRRSPETMQMELRALLSPDGPLAQAAAQHGPELRAEGLCPEQASVVLAVRGELCELDVRYGRLEPDGFYREIEPWLEPGPPGVERIAEAMSEPPATTRARLRGEQVRLLAGRPGCRAGWTGVVDDRGMRLDLSDPSGREARWVRLRDVRASRGLRELYLAARASYVRGDLAEAQRLARRVLALRSVDDPCTTEASLMTLLARVESRRGQTEHAVAILDDLRRRWNGAATLPADYVAVHRFQGLIPRAEAGLWIARAEPLLRAGGLPAAARAALLGHAGHVLSRTGALERAGTTLRAAFRVRRLSGDDARIAARNCVAMADVLRLGGRRRRAAAWLDRAEAIYAAGDYAGDAADYLWTARARLVSTAEALPLLRRARAVQARLGNQIGLARTLLLQARLVRTRRAAERRRREILRIRELVPDLSTCPLLGRILQRWDEWADGGRLAVCENGDPFWLL